MNERKKVLMLATTAAMIEQFNKNNILILEEMEYEVHVIGNWEIGNPISSERLEQFKVWLGEHHGKWFHMDSIRKPYDLKNNISSYKKVINLIHEHKYEFIHCHTPIGSVIGRLAAHKTKTKVIYTAHGFHFYDGAPIINWMLYYPVEKFLSRWTDVLILINEEDYGRAKKHFFAKQIYKINGVGIPVEDFIQADFDRNKYRQSMGFSEDDFIVISVGEVNTNKNHEVIIRAIKLLNNKTIKYIVCGKGKLENELKELAQNMNIGDQVNIIGYRDDIKELLLISDVFAFPSRREGLGLAAIEAMASGLPIITSNIHGINDYSMNGKTGFKYGVDDISGYAEGIKTIFENKNLADEMKMYNRNIAFKYDIKDICVDMKKIYIALNM